MSTIGSDYSAHRRSVEDLEQEYDTASRKAKEREQTREAKLEKNLETTVRRKDKDTEEAVRNVKDQYESSMHDMAKSDRIEREKFKQSVYDRNGRRLSATEDSANSDRDRALEAAAATEARSAKAISDTEAYQNQQSAAAADRHEKEMEALADSYRKQIDAARGSESDEDRQNTQDYRKKLSEESQSAIRQAREEVMAERRQSKALAEQTDYVLKDRSKKADFLLNTRLREKDLAVKQELNKHSEAERQSRALETQPLREQIMETAGLERDVARAKNDARAGAIKELESDWNAKYANQSLSHELEKQKLQSDNADAGRVYGQKLGNYMKESDTKTAQKIANQNSEHRDQMTSASREYDRSLAHVKLGAEHDKKLSNDLLNRERSEASSRQDRAIATQAGTYQETLKNQRVSQEAQIKNLERIVNVKNSTSDAGEISAGAEQTVRTAVTKQYDKTFQAEADRNAQDRDHLNHNYQARLSDAYRDNQTNATNLNRKNLSEQSVMRHEFEQHVSDVEDNKRQMLNLASDANSKMSETTQRTHEREMNEIRRHYEDLVGARDGEHANRFEELRNQSEFDKRTMRRDYTAQTADLIRGYEKKLTEQKVTSDETLRETNAKLETKSRESDKRLMQALAEQARGYDHRMAELEAQSKDRERLANQQHEDELDRVKKANALLLSKKG
jgi:hypothetical protein